MRWLLLSLTLVIACRGNGDADVRATRATDGEAEAVPDVLAVTLSKLAPGSSGVAKTTLPSPIASPGDSPISDVTITVTGETTTSRQIRAPAFVLPIER